MMITFAVAGTLAVWLQESQTPPAAAPKVTNSCLECHGDTEAVLKKSAHYMVACAACHGGDIRVRRNLTPEEKKARAHSTEAPEPFVAVPDDKCARCHKNENEAWLRGAHGLPMKSRGAVGCKHCHAEEGPAPSAHRIRHFSFHEGGLPGRLRTGIEGAFVHRIGLFDAKKKLVDAKSVEPYSPMTTCGKCHDYASISMGWHFQAGRPGAEDGRPGEPWILRDEATRTQIPLSHRAWPGTFRPAEVGLTDWEFARLFGTHHPGGGLMEWTRDGKRRDTAEEPGSKWRAQGVHGIDCLTCHLASPYNREERSLQVRATQFRLAPEAGLGLSAIRPAVRKVTSEGDEIYEPLPPSAKPPPAGVVCVPIREASRFDAEGRVLLDLTRHPPDRNCLACHATRVPGSEAPSERRDRDVHLAAGLRCTDCHRNGIDHRITRGDGSASDRRSHPENGTLSCRGCHDSGRLGAPPIPHAGLPSFHLEKIACTTCHSGPPPEAAAGAVLTARAHGMGIAAEEPSGDPWPVVLGPVYRQDGQGQIRPHYALWPAWYGERKDGRLVPLPLKRVAEAAGEPGKTPADPAVVLAALKKNGVSEPVRVAGGRVHRLEGDVLVSCEAPEAEPYLWPIGHAVRSASQALGARACSDCHSVGSPFFFGTVTASPPGPGGSTVARRRHEFLGMGSATIHLGAAAVMMREGGMTFIAVLLVLGLLGGALAHMALGARIGAWLGVPAARASGPAPDFGLPLRWVHFGSWVLLLLLIATGTGFLMTYGPRPLPNFFSSRHAVRVHVAAGLAFAALLPVLAAAWVVLGVLRKRGADWVNAWGGFLWMARGRGDGKIGTWDRLWIWFDLACALAVALTGLVMVMRVPAVGSLAGEALRRLPDHHLLGPLAYALHGTAGAALIGRLAMHLYAVLFLRKR